MYVLYIGLRDVHFVVESCMDDNIGQLTSRSVANIFMMDSIRGGTRV